MQDKVASRDPSREESKLEVESATEIEELSARDTRELLELSLELLLEAL